MAEPWFVEAFRSPYLEVYAHRDLEAARIEARFLVGRGVRGRVLDLCCGSGRHCAALRELGVEAFGIDLSRELLGRARAQARSLDGRVVCGDARALPISAGTLDGVVSLFSSFGYFDAAGDRAVLREVGRVLRARGVFLLDLMNPAQVRKSLVPRSVSERAGFEIDETRTLVDAGRRVRKEVQLRARDGSTSTWREDVRLYESRELRPWLSDAGLDFLAEYGDFDGSSLAEASPRQILLLVKR